MTRETCNHVDMADICELAHELTIIECAYKGINYNKVDGTQYSKDAQLIYDFNFVLITHTLNV